MASCRNAGRCIGVAVVALIAIAVCVALGPRLWSFFSDIDRVRDWIGAQGALAPIAMLAIVIAQVVVAILPGEPIELAAGYLFGFWGGTALCLLGALVGTLAVVALARAFGMRVVHLFFSQGQVESVPWLKDSTRLEALMFATLLVPGTPKDVLTYAAALTTCSWCKIAVITTIGRVPSVVSSTLAAGFAAEGDWHLAAVVMGVTMVLALAGGALYAAVKRRAGGTGL